MEKRRVTGVASSASEMALLLGETEVTVLTEEGKGRGFSENQFSLAGPVKKLLATGNHFLALLEDGSVYGFGRGLFPSVHAFGIPGRISDLPPLRDIATSALFNYGLDENGQMLVWNRRLNISVAIDDIGLAEKPETRGGLPPLTAIAGVLAWATALTQDGHVLIWNLGPGKPPSELPLEEVTKIVGSGVVTLTLNSAGKVHLVIPDVGNTKPFNGEFVVLESPIAHPVSDVAGGQFSFFYLLQDKRVGVWGRTEADLLEEDAKGRYLQISPHSPTIPLLFSPINGLLPDMESFLTEKRRIEATPLHL